MIASSNPGNPEERVIFAERSCPSPEMVMSTSAERSATLSGLLSSSFSPMSRRKLSVQRR